VTVCRAGADRCTSSWSCTVPSMRARASGLSSSRLRRRFSGRAPYTGSAPAWTMAIRGVSYEHCPMRLPAPRTPDHSEPLTDVVRHKQLEVVPAQPLLHLAQAHVHDGAHVALSEPVEHDHLRRARQHGTVAVARRMCAKTSSMRFKNSGGNVCCRVACTRPRVSSLMAPSGSCANSLAPTFDVMITIVLRKSTCNAPLGRAPRGQCQ
jgi:hypothetical protein